MAKIFTCNSFKLTHFKLVSYLYNLLYVMEHRIVGNGICCGILVLSRVSLRGFYNVFSIAIPLTLLVVECV